MSFNWRGLAPLAASFLLVTATSTYAEGLDHRLAADEAPQTLFQVAESDLGLDEQATVGDALDDLDLGEHQLLEDFHPETDRWTDRNNRIRISLRISALLFSEELRVDDGGGLGFRISWEVPGFIGIRWDSTFAIDSRLQLREPGTGRRRYIPGLTHFHTLSLGIFNPELSISGLAFWAGFGGSLWIYDYDDTAYGNTVTYQDSNISGNIFIELDYEIADVFHVSVEIRQHIVLAPQTDDGRFYENNGVVAGVSGRNDGQFDDIAGVTELSLNFSVLF